MSDCVSKLSRAAVWRLIFVWCLCCALVFGAAVFSACTAHAQTTASASAGADYWHAPDTPARYLPNYSTPHAWKSVTPWVRGQLQHQTDTDAGPLTLTISGKTDPVNRGRIDRLDADLRLGQGGARLGILPYRISWCRADGGPWMSEPDAFCRFAGLNEVSEGAAGVQAYRSTLAGGWLIDGMAGLYRPLIDGQNKKLGPYVSVGPTVKHEAYGASLNGTHLPTGIEARAGWLRTKQDQDSDAGSYQRRLRYDSYYLGLQGNVTRSLDLRASLAGYRGDQVNPASPYTWDGRSTTLEAIYKITPSHSIALGWSRYTNRTTYAKAPNHQALHVTSRTLAYRADLPDGWWAVLQAGDTLDDATTRQGKQTVREGTAYGLRVAKTF